MARVKFLQHMSGSWSVLVGSTMGFAVKRAQVIFACHYTKSKKVKVIEDFMTSLLFYLVSRLFAEELSSTNQFL